MKRLKFKKFYSITIFVLGVLVIILIITSFFINPFLQLSSSTQKLNENFNADLNLSVTYEDQMFAANGTMDVNFKEGKTKGNFFAGTKVVKSSVDLAVINKELFFKSGVNFFLLKQWYRINISSFYENKNFDVKERFQVDLKDRTKGVYQFDLKPKTKNEFDFVYDEFIVSIFINQSKTEIEKITIKGKNIKFQFQGLERQIQSLSMEALISKSNSFNVERPSNYIESKDILKLFN